MQEVVGQELVDLFKAGVEGALYQPPQRPLRQVFCGRIDWHEAARVRRLVPALQQLVLRRLKGQLPPEHAHLAAERHQRAGPEGSGNVRVVEPEGANGPGFVAQHRLRGSPPRPGVSLRRLPHGRHDRPVLAGLKLRYLGDVREVVVAVREQVDEVADPLNAELLELGQVAAAHALEAGDFVAQRQRLRPRTCASRGSPAAGCWCAFLRRGGLLQPAEGGGGPLLALGMCEGGVGLYRPEKRDQLLLGLLEEAVQPPEDRRVPETGGLLPQENLDQRFDLGVVGVVARHAV